MSGFRWTAGEVGRALGLDIATDDGTAFSEISTDTRKIAPGTLFVALHGENFDAHEFLPQAAASGATGAVVARVPADAPEGLQLFRVDDTLHALGALARHRRRALSGRVLAVAGSNGKTTTKDLLRAALSTRFRVHATQGNLNNQVGVPLTLLATPDDAEAVVVEVGTNEPGEIAILAAIAEPEAGIITSIGEEHLEKLIDLAGVLDEETSLLPGITEDGPVFIAEEPVALAERARAALGDGRVRVAGFSEAADLRPDGGREGVRVLPDGSTEWSWNGVGVRVPLPGMHNVRNALLALGLAEAWGVPPTDAAAGIAAMPSPKMRNEWRKIGEMGVLADCYNSNPPSLLAAVDLLASIPSNGAKVAVVGTMRELGEQTAALHRSAAESIAARVGGGIDRVVATGAFVDAFAPHAQSLGDRLISEADPLEAYERARGGFDGTETVLLKGSRGEALERWLPLLERDWAAGS